MVRGLGFPIDNFHLSPERYSFLIKHGNEALLIHLLGAGTTDQNSVLAQDLHCHAVQFKIAFHGLCIVLLLGCKLRRIQDNQVEFLPSCRLFFLEIEYL